MSKTLFSTPKNTIYIFKLSCNVLFIILYSYQNLLISYLILFFIRQCKDLDESKCRRYEKCVQDVVATVSQMANPFDIEQDKLINLASGEVLETVAANRLLIAEELGEKQFLKFMEENLFSKEPNPFATLEKNKLQTFSSSKQKVAKGCKENSVKLNRTFFARLLVISKNREIDLNEVFTYSLGSFPLSLATATGGLVKTAKSKLLDIIESEAGNPEVDLNSFQNNALMVDAMAVLQIMKGKLY